MNTRSQNQSITAPAAALFALMAAVSGGPVRIAADEPPGKAAPLTGRFSWRTGPSLVLPRDLDGDRKYSIKDPSIVRHGGRWHLFCTVRGKKRSHAIVHLSFADWEQADSVPRRVLPMHDGFFCAPQVFYFRPHGRWYLICQAADEAWTPRYGPAFAVSDDLADPAKWSKLEPLIRGKPEGARAWLDFWVICDERHAYLFFTSLDGKMWRCRTPIEDFPTGFSKPVVALEGDVFEASHTYRLKGMDKYLTVIEAQGGHGWRYYKAYLADRLDGHWTPLAAEKDKAFASMKKVKFAGGRSGRWTDAISHGELIRAGADERLEVDPASLRFLFQGVLDVDRRGKPYGQIPWRLGILEPKAE